MKGLFVATDANGSIFYILYTADQEEYSKTLPIVVCSFGKDTKYLNYLIVLYLLVQQVTMNKCTTIGE